jgi:hypothetical protein
MDEIISYKMCAVKVRNAKLRNFLNMIARAKLTIKMILTGNYTCSRSINEKSHLCLAKYL